MTLKSGKKHNCAGSTLIGSMVAITIILLAIIGTSNLRYHTALDSRKANTQVEASSIALLLSESWRGIEGDENYDPVSHLGTDVIIASSSGPPAPDGYTQLGSYQIQLDNNNDGEYQINYYVTMSWKDVQTGLRAMTVTVAWAQRDDGDSSYSGTDKTYSLTSYILL